jgi:iron-sulfur cluster assembly protein
MFNVTESAQEQVALYFKDKEVKPIRLFLSNGCGGAQLALAVDDAHGEDQVFEFAGVQYLVDPGLLSQAQPIEIDFTSGGFSIQSSIPQSSGCGGCGSSESCCH